MANAHTETMDLPMVLNYDVLLAVMSHLSGSELLPAMQTCRTLYTGGAPYLLRAPVVLRSRARVLSFCYFILTEPSRFQFLRALEIRAPGHFQPGPKADLFLAMVMHAKYLEDLKILDCEILMSDRRIPPAVASLTSLKSLAFPALNEAATKILTCSRSSLNKVEIGFWSDDAVGPGDPVPLLSLFSHCLRELRVTYAEFARSNVQYTRVGVLVIDDCRFALAQPLIRCFPNVRDLSLWTGQEDEELEDEEIEEHRQANSHAQQQASWTYLEYLRGDIRSLYLLGLTCQVRFIDVHSTFLTAARARQLSALLSGGRPFALSIRINISEFDMQILGDLLRPIENSLARLTVYLDFCSLISRENSRAEEAIKCLISSIAHTSLARLVLRLCCDDTELDLLVRLDIEMFADMAATHIPSLRHFLLVDSNRQPLACWVMTTGTTPPQRFGDAEALAMLAEEGNSCD